MKSPSLQPLDEEISRLLRVRARRVAGRQAALQGAGQLLRLSESFPVRAFDGLAFNQAVAGAAALDVSFERRLRELNQEMANLFQEWDTLELTRQEFVRRKQESERVIDDYRRQIRELQNQHLTLWLIGGGLLLLLLILIGCNS